MKQYELINMPTIKHSIVKLNTPVIGDILEALYYYLKGLPKDRKTILVINLENNIGEVSAHFFNCFIDEYVKEGINTLVLELNLFPNLELALISEDIGNCLNMRLYSKEEIRTSYLSWISTKEDCKYENKDIKTLIYLSDQINRIFNIRETFLSDEAKISCFDFVNEERVSVNLSITNIFKYGETYYQKYGFSIDYDRYLDEGEMAEVFNSRGSIENFFDKVRKTYIGSMQIPLNIEFYKNKSILDKIKIYKDNSNTIGEFFFKILKDDKLGCYIFDKIFKNMVKNNIILRRLVLLIEDTYSYYHKIY